MPTSTPHRHQQECDRLLDLTQDHLRAERLTALKDHREEALFTWEYASRILILLDLASRVLRLCQACTQRRTANQWSRYCYVTCSPPQSAVPLDDDPTGNLRLVYPDKPTASHLLRDAGLDTLPIAAEPASPETSPDTPTTSGA